MADPFWTKEKISLAVEFSVCFLGLQVSYLLWGLMQELIMNTQYTPTPLNPSGMFPSATFCVFSNRFIAIIFSAVCCLRVHGTVLGSASLLSFTPCALSNTMSSWAQYRALSYVSFSLQTLFKSTKVVPVMIMGKLIKGTNYDLESYLEAFAITGGVCLFSFGNQEHTSNDGVIDSNIMGVALLATYVLCDSFTAQWQSKLYKDYGKIDHYHMMFGVNASSIVFTTAALLLAGELPAIIEFFVFHPQAFWFNVVTAITSTTGQVAIYYTIKRFGPIVFTIIMTTRQMLSIVLSTLLFGHHISLQSLLGAAVVFLAVFYSIHRQSHRARTSTSPSSSSSSLSGGSSSSSGDDRKGENSA